MLQDNSGDDLTISANGSFTFPTKVNSGAGYTVTVKTPPSTQTCIVASGSGTANANVTSVAVSCASITYTLVTIPPLPPSSSGAVVGPCSATGVNDSGIVIGNCGERAWVFDSASGALTELTLDPNETGDYATAVSNTGTIAGWAYDPTIIPGYWTTTGGAAVLDSPDYCMPSGINNNGAIVGSCGNSGSPGAAAYMWSGPSYAVRGALPTLQCKDCARTPVGANAINDAGLIVGFSTYDLVGGGPEGPHAVEWSLTSVIANCIPPVADVSACSGAITDLDTGDSQDSVATAVNNAAQPLIVGQIGNTYANLTGHAALWTAPGKVTDLGTLPGDQQSIANAVNDGGEIVGQSVTVASSSQNNVYRAFLYVNGHMYDLNSLIDPTTPLPASITLSSAAGINTSGEIAVNATVTTTTTGDNGAPMTQTTGAPNAYILVPKH